MNTTVLTSNRTIPERSKVLSGDFICHSIRKIVSSYKSAEILDLQSPSSSVILIQTRVFTRSRPRPDDRSHSKYKYVVFSWDTEMIDIIIATVTCQYHELSAPWEWPLGSIECTYIINGSEHLGVFPMRPHSFYSDRQSVVRDASYYERC